MEIPDLCLPSIRGFDHHVSVVYQVKISVALQFRNHVEISLNIETKVSVEFTFNWLIWILISIDNFPLLIDSSMLVVDLNVLILIIESSRNIHDLSSLINDELTV
jgi:hypothetical protein